MDDLGTGRDDHEVFSPLRADGRGEISKEDVVALAFYLFVHSWIETIDSQC